MKLAILIFCGVLFTTTSTYAQKVRYNYDKASRLSSFVKNDTLTILYAYDKDGNRTSQIISNFTLAVNPSLLKYPKYSGTKKVGVASNTNWTASSNQSWVTLNKLSGTGSDSVAITTANNPNGTSRTAIVSFIAGNLIEIVTITQDSSSTSSGTQENEEMLNRISIYPNPSPGIFTVSFGNTAEGNLIQVYELSGRLLQEIHSQSNKQQINMEAYSKGLYVLRIRTEYGTFNSKILLE